MPSHTLNPMEEQAPPHLLPPVSPPKSPYPPHPLPELLQEQPKPCLPGCCQALGGQGCSIGCTLLPRCQPILPYCSQLRSSCCTHKGLSLSWLLLCLLVVMVVVLLLLLRVLLLLDVMVLELVRLLLLLLLLLLLCGLRLLCVGGGVELVEGCGHSC